MLTFGMLIASTEKNNAGKRSTGEQMRKTQEYRGG
jgi:hypothetical protein